MSARNIFIALTILTFGGSGWAHDCSNVIEIESHGLLNYLANVSFLAPHNFSGEWALEMSTDVEFTFLGGWGIWVRSTPEEGKASFRSRQNDLEIEAGDLVTFRFRISWFTGETEPRVNSLIWEGVELCREGSPQGSKVISGKSHRSRRQEQEQPARRRTGRRRMKLPIN